MRSRLTGWRAWVVVVAAGVAAVGVAVAYVVWVTREVSVPVPNIPGDGAGGAGRDPDRSRPAGRRLGRPRAGPGHVPPSDPAGGGPGSGSRRGRPGRCRVPRRPGRPPTRRPAGAFAAIGDLSPAGP